MNAPLSPAVLAPSNPSSWTTGTPETGRAWMSGIHALVRLPMMQRLRDSRAGLNTAGFVSGYRGRRWAAWTRTCGRPPST